MLSVAICFYNDCLLFCSEGYFPASGIRRCEQGFLGNVSSEGSCWSSSSVANASSFGSAFYSLAATTSLCYLGYRGHARPVRCVQELACVLYRSIIKARSAVECSDSQ